ncbi:hypothetical protein JOQ06_022780 [Pogonophryne albipinna]|uniref:Uncharacterized protein n=1 Tax=Pogonophryne albipinna TaxID=1090488 RepID=A0AAD6F421_9TELE|nr:hypothetical protein JOQ06_022780 [Pogonophryne albipinna]
MYRPGRNKWKAECTVCKACTYQKPPIVIKKFFENEFSEIYLWHMHSLMSAFHTHIQDMEKEKNSIMEYMSGVSGEVDDSHGRVLHIHVDGSE